MTSSQIEKKQKQGVLFFGGEFLVKKEGPPPGETCVSYRMA